MSLDDQMMAVGTTAGTMQPGETVRVVVEERLDEEGRRIKVYLASERVSKN